MNKLKLFLIGLYYASIVSSQDTNIIKIEKINERTWYFYDETDTNILVKIIDKKGRLNEIRRYKDTSLATENGEWLEFNNNQSIITKRYFNNGFPEKVWEYYNSNGKIINSINYDFQLEYFQNVAPIKSQDEIKDTSKIVILEIMPKFKGGDLNDFRMYLYKNFRVDFYMAEKFEKTGVNKIIVQFAVDKDGNVVNVKALDEGKKFLEKDAVRLIKNSPKWTPGYQNDVPEKVQFTFPFVYVFP